MIKRILETGWAFLVALFLVHIAALLMAGTGLIMAFVLEQMGAPHDVSMGVGMPLGLVAGLVAAGCVSGARSNERIGRR